MRVVEIDDFPADGITYVTTLGAGCPDRPEVVTLCGSMRFVRRILAVAAEETAKGRIVLAPFAVVASADQDSEFKRMLDRLHRQKIAVSDRVVVVTDETGYYGHSTGKEIEFARELTIPVEMRAVPEWVDHL